MRIQRHKGSILSMDLSLVGHPLSPIGMGEHIRKTCQALSSVGVRPSSVVDIYQLNNQMRGLFNTSNVDNELLNKGLKDINIFHINGDEVEQSLAHLRFESLNKGYNIIYPAWELPGYPLEWARQLDRFDEIWAPSKFIKEALERVCKKKVFHMPLACNVNIRTYYPRKFFNIPEDRYAFLFFFDLRSYSTRKNPAGILEAFKKIFSLDPLSSAHLILKIHGVDEPESGTRIFEKFKSELGPNLTIIDEVLSEDQIRSLVLCADCFLSLHRAEGFGRGIAEAMMLGKPVIATAWSGNLDFMKESNSFGVGYELISIADGEYPFWQEQFWADPDINQAVNFMQYLISNPEAGQRIGHLARLDMQKDFGLMPIGTTYRERLELIKGLHTEKYKGIA